MSFYSLEGKAALITGASGGVGEAICEVFARCGASIIASGSNEEKLKNLVSKLKDYPIKYEVCDLSNLESTNGLIAKAASHFGSLDILVSNAGITKDNLSIRMSDEDFENVIDVNLRSSFILSREAIKIMMKKRYGRIINISSVIGFSGNAGQANYAASKAGMVAMSKSLAREVASRNITINCIAPGFITTPMTDILKEDIKEMILKSIPMNKFGVPQDVANAALFLASEESHYITGQTIHVNGGSYM